MKQLLLIYCLLYCSLCISQTQLPLKSGGISFDSVVHVNNRTSSELSKIAMVWFQKDLPSLNSKIIKAEDGNNSIIAEGSLAIPMPIYRNDVGYINYTFEVSFKDGRYKYSLITDDRWDNRRGDKLYFEKLNSQNKRIHEESRYRIMSVFNAFLNSFNRHMAEPDKDDNW